jgi:hypothetical protein
VESCSLASDQNTRVVNGHTESLQVADPTGRIEEGNRADMIVVLAISLAGVDALQNLLLVIGNGQLVMKRIAFSVSD